MKQTLLALALCFAGGLAAQSASIFIRNHSTTCTYFVTLYATDVVSGNTAGCSIATNSIRILPGGTYARGNPDHVASLGPGYSFIASPVVLSTVTTWRWTDAIFQTDCAAGCFNTTGFLSNAATTNCLSAGAIWATGMASYCWCNATWFPSPSAAMANTIIDLY